GCQSVADRPSEPSINVSALLSPGGAAVGSQGRKPLALPPLRGWDLVAVSGQGLTPLATDRRPSGAETPVGTDPPPVIPPPPCGERPLDLAAALGLAGAANPTIALAREAVRAATAERLAADALLLPTLHAGADYNRHFGHLPS